MDIVNEISARVIEKHGPVTVGIDRDGFFMAVGSSGKVTGNKSSNFVSALLNLLVKDIQK